MPHYYPLLLNLESKTCLVVGAGSVGARKVAGLLEAGSKVRLVATTIADAAADLQQSSLVQLKLEPYRVEHLDGVSLAFAATNNRAVNAQVVADALSKNIPVNCAGESDDRNQGGEFIVPSVVRRGELCIAVSTGGASPKLAKRIRADLDDLYGVEYAGYVELLSYMRSYIKERVEDSGRRAAALQSLVDETAESLLRTLFRDSDKASAFEAAKLEAIRIVEAALFVSPE